MRINYATDTALDTSGIQATAMAVDSSKRRKLYAILSEGLYTDKAMAVIRELASNAHDSHVAAGNTDRAIELHAPTTAEPFYSIRDFGTGLTATEGEATILSYLGSSKDDDDAFIGGWGLGSKSPFAYTNHYFIDLYKGGQHWRYDCFRDDAGMPNSAQTEASPTDEPDGVRVTVPTPVGWYEISRFNARLRTYLRNTDFNLVVTNAADADQSFPRTVACDVMAGPSRVRILPSDGDGSAVLYGGFAYPISTVKGWDDNDSKWLDGFRELWSNCSLQLVAAVGDCDFTPSRDTMVSSNKTREFILRACRNIMDELRNGERDRQRSVIAAMTARLAGADGKLPDVVTMQQLVAAQQAVFGGGAANGLSAYVKPHRLRKLWSGDQSVDPGIVRVELGVGDAKAWVYTETGGGSPSSYTPSMLIAVPLHQQLVAVRVPGNCKISEGSRRSYVLQANVLVVASDDPVRFARIVAAAGIPEACVHDGPREAIVSVEFARQRASSYRPVGLPPQWVVDCRDPRRRWRYRQRETYVMAGDDCSIESCRAIAAILGVTAVFVPSKSFRDRHCNPRRQPLDNLVSIRDPRYQAALATAAALAASGPLIDKVLQMPRAYQLDFAKALHMPGAALLFNADGIIADRGDAVSWCDVEVPGHEARICRTRARIQRLVRVAATAFAEIRSDDLFTALDRRFTGGYREHGPARRLPDAYDRPFVRMIRSHCNAAARSITPPTTGEPT